MTECVDDETVCSHEQRCSVRANWQRINQAVYAALETIKLSDMAEPNGGRLVQLALSSGAANKARSGVERTV